MRPTPFLVGIIGALLALAFVATEMVRNDTGASYFLATGELHPVREYVEERLGSDIYLRPEAGHDGKFAFLQAHDPLITNPDLFETYMERPVYRLQRQLLPALAAPALLLGEHALVLWLVAINVVAVGLGSWAVARLGRHAGLSPWFGAAFLLNPGIFSSIVAGTADTLAWALAITAVVFYLERRPRATIAFLAAAALGREAMLLVAAGLAWDAWRSRSDRKLALQIATLPALTVAAWAVYVRIRMDVPLATTQSREIGAPFAGLADAVSGWFVEPGDLDSLLGFANLALIAIFVLLAWEHRNALSRATVGFALITPLLTAAVWTGFWDISRAVAPIFTAMVVLVGERLIRQPESGRPQPVSRLQ